MYLGVTILVSKDSEFRTSRLSTWFVIAPPLLLSLLLFIA
ncbi:hypothetical protein CY0110_17307 [Crocosphaera chwakensis CCY0110]|uniref:Uncharacterized protein n=1 Tax=Crocosphaera chwakensis CCY0110 TaxID=391612 RepID=A3IIE3_9CHRO|nr:hypothetical protein CY0110_17307 [Crocosphaera chwakensis CCY0110]